MILCALSIPEALSLCSLMVHGCLHHTQRLPRHPVYSFQVRYPAHSIALDPVTRTHIFVGPEGDRLYKAEWEQVDQQTGRDAGIASPLVAIPCYHGLWQEALGIGSFVSLIPCCFTLSVASNSSAHIAGKLAGFPLPAALQRYWLSLLF